MSVHVETESRRGLQLCEGVVLVSAILLAVASCVAYTATGKTPIFLDLFSRAQEKFDLKFNVANESTHREHVLKNSENTPINVVVCCDNHTRSTKRAFTIKEKISRIMHYDHLVQTNSLSSNKQEVSSCNCKANPTVALVTVGEGGMIRESQVKCYAKVFNEFRLPYPMSLLYTVQRYFLHST